MGALTRAYGEGLRGTMKHINDRFYHWWTTYWKTNPKLQANISESIVQDATMQLL